MRLRTSARRLSLSLLLIASPSLSLAEDVRTLAPVTAAEIYLSGALLTREATVDLPVGSHRILIPHAPRGVPRLTVTGAALGPVETLPGSLVDGRAAFTAGQRAAYDTLQAAEEAFHRAEDDRLRAASEMKAADDALAMLRSFSGAHLETLQPDAVGPFTAAVTANITAAEIARADARAALRVAEQARDEAHLRREQARQVFTATGAQTEAVSQLAVGVTVVEAGTVTVSMDSFTPDAGWSPRYDIFLGADDVVTFERKAVVFQQTPLAFDDVTLTLSTVDPYAQIAPSPVPPNQAIYAGPGAKRGLGSYSLGDSAEPSEFQAQSEARAEAPLSVPPRQALTANAEGVVVTYNLPVPITLQPSVPGTTLDLDTVTTEARVFNRASVRRDRTAFLMAGITNTIGEPLLPGQAVFYRGDTRIGEATLPLIPAGDDADLSFGPQQFLRVEFAALENQTSDRGLFASSGTRVQDLVFRVRNLSGEDTEVEARYALPFAEEEDLQIDLSADPRPDRTDIDDAQGVSDWILTVPAGGETEVNIRVSLEWPEGKALNWAP